MNLLLLAPEELGEDNCVVLRDRRAEHLLRVLRVEPGRQLRAGSTCGRLGTAEVISTGPGEVTLRLQLGVRPGRPTIDVVLALPRPKVVSRVLESLAAFGVGRIALVNAWRVDKSYFDTPRLEHAALERSLRLGCEQGGQVCVPELGVERLFVPFLRERLPSWLDAPGARGLLAHPYAERGIEEVLPRGHAGRVVVAIGPEGGWIPAELESFERVGFTSVSLGTAVLRVEAAVVALLSQVQLLCRWRGAAGESG